ncbi:hypothetical protein AVEN_178892-1 [Araneus ventricosus]|uniref:Uncharacterized protein n=1 Tax=Araneus ventricosus TaxID=182803 RepID=A0A4Y2FY05_ARAVE|nr:hypothetical protein AVEN_70544-1 [Araneus ventricosus]GBM45933.1 hypothetical protein AVEN_178892-1 [Araneus ventricosus]
MNLTVEKRVKLGVLSAGALRSKGLRPQWFGGRGPALSMEVPSSRPYYTKNESCMWARCALYLPSKDKYPPDDVH